MTSREAFEAWAQQNAIRTDYGSWEGWQAAIQHARDVAVKVLEADPFADAQDCADAIKEALK